MAISLGGSSASQVNDNKVINSKANSITTESGEVWLKSGVVSTDTTTYPDGTAFMSGATYTSTNWSVASQMGLPSGITWDGSFFWVCDRTNSGLVYKYNASGAYQSVSFATSGDSENMGIVWNGSHFYIGGSNAGTIKRYNASGAIDSGWSITSQSGVQGVAIIGSVIYVLRLDGYIYYYNITSSGGTYTGNNINTAAQLGGAEQTLATDGESLYAVSTAGVAYKYDPLPGGAGYLGVSFSVNPLSSSAIDFGGLAFKGTELYSTNATDDKVFKFNEALSVGLNSLVETDGGTIYTRIK